jgi:hypothetical protein
MVSDRDQGFGPGVSSEFVEVHGRRITSSVRRTALDGGPTAVDLGNIEIAS